MPPINHLNPSPNPFWDIVADMQSHPFFGAYGPPTGPGQSRGPEHPNPEAGPSNSAGQQQREKQQEQTNAEDPPEVDPATLREQQQTRERCGRGRRRGPSSSEEEGGPHRECPGRRGWGRRRGWGGPGGFEPAGFPFGGPFWARGPHPPPPPPPEGEFGPGFVPGARGCGGFYHRGGPLHYPHGPFGHRHHGRHGRRGPSPPPGPPGFDVAQFLNDLDTRIGMDLSGAAASLGLDRFMPSQDNPEVDFEPKVDIFDRVQDYIVHISLPGAKKSDVGVDWDGEHSALRVAGVVHRPEVDETMLGQLVVDGRKRETGVFEKMIRLGTRRDPAVIDISHISARMIDGVLVVTLPKGEKQHERREVPIAKSQTPSPVREVREKEMLFDADHDHQMSEAEHKTHGQVQLIDLTKNNTFESNKSEKEEHGAKQKSRESSATVEEEPAPQQEQEQLPAYNPVEHHDGSDWEHFDSDEEGEFVKINVD